RAARLKRPLHRAMLRRADAVIAVSDVVRRSLHDMSRAAAAPVHLVRHGIADIAPGASPRRERDGATPVILFAGRLSAEKRPALLVDAVARMHTRADVWIAGEGAQRRAVEEAARRLGPGRVRLLGGVGDVGRVMRVADVLALASQVEGFGLVALEA